MLTKENIQLELENIIDKMGGGITMKPFVGVTIEDTIAYLRVLISYQIMDLEATRREYECLVKQMLEG